jgi:hypothetical protein
VFVNLFIPSVLTWKEKGLKIRQETAYPEEATIRLKIDSASGVSLTLYLRYPSWAVSGALIKVNGQKIVVTQAPGSYIPVTRKWKRSDRVEITYPMSLRLVPTPDNPAVAAIAYGPVILAGEMGTEGMRRPYHDPSDPYEYYDYDYRVPAGLVHTLKTGNGKIADWLRPTGVPLEFVTEGLSGAPILMEPYYRLHRERYTVYWDLD